MTPQTPVCAFRRPLEDVVQNIELQELKCSRAPSVLSNEPSMRRTLLPFLCYMERPCQPIALKQVRLLHIRVLAIISVADSLVFQVCALRFL